LSLDISIRFSHLILLYVHAMLIVVIRISSSQSVLNKQCLAGLKGFMQASHSKPGIFALLNETQFWIVDEILVLMDTEIQHKRFGKDNSFAKDFEQGYIDAVFEYIEEYYLESDWRLLGTCTDSSVQQDVSVVMSLSDSADTGTSTSTNSSRSGSPQHTDSLDEHVSDRNLVDHGQPGGDAALEAVVEEDDDLFGMLSPWSAYTISDNDDYVCIDEHQQG
jgi:hypothetical protein